MRLALAKLHPVLMIFAVAGLWFIGATAFIFLLSLLDVPGINEHGSVIFLLLAWLFAAIAALVHTYSILAARRAEAKR
jgi:hypothetical protein